MVTTWFREVVWVVDFLFFLRVASVGSVRHGLSADPRLRCR